MDHEFPGDRRPQQRLHRPTSFSDSRNRREAFRLRRDAFHKTLNALNVIKELSETASDPDVRALAKACRTVLNQNIMRTCELADVVLRLDDDQRQQ